MLCGTIADLNHDVNPTFWLSMSEFFIIDRHAEDVFLQNINGFGQSIYHLKTLDSWISEM